jgi:hypothetical protein
VHPTDLKTQVLFQLTEHLLSNLKCPALSKACLFGNYQTRLHRIQDMHAIYFEFPGVKRNIDYDLTQHLQELTITED